jgi:hypothetical protein
MPSDDPVASAPSRIGAVGIAPRISLSNFSVDTNVFNTVSDPQRDFTFTVSPGTDLFLRTGRGLLTVSGGVDLVYFQEFDTERSLNSNARGQYEFRFNRLRPYASASTLNTRQRPGFEIDARARHYESDFHVGSDVRFMSKSMVRVDVRHLDYKFAGDEVFNGRPLNQELNRTLEAVDLGWRQRVTALTTWVTRVSRERERFEFENDALLRPDRVDRRSPRRRKCPVLRPADSFHAADPDPGSAVLLFSEFLVKTWKSFGFDPPKRCSNKVDFAPTRIPAP